MAAQPENIADSYEFSLIGSKEAPFGGYVSSIDPTNCSPELIVRGSRNVYKKNSGTYANRPGLKRRGTPDATLAGTLASYEEYSSLGVTIPMRVNNGNLQFESLIADGTTYVWYTLLSGITLTRYVFDSWWDDTNKKDVVLMVHGDSTIESWSGGIATIASATLNTITIAGTQTWQQMGFDATGSVIINGNTYAYTGGAGTPTLTGVTGSPASEPAGSVAYQTVVTHSSLPVAGFSADFLRVIGNRAHIGSYTSREVYISSNVDYTNYTVPTPRVTGSPELLTLDNTGKGITVSKGNAFISAGRKDWYEISYSPLTVGTTATEQTLVTNLPTAELSAAIAHEFIDTVGDDIVYLTQDQQLRQLGTFRNLTTPNFPSLSIEIEDEMKQETFISGPSVGHLRAVSDKIYITAPVTGRTYIRQTRETVDSVGNVVAERLWFSPMTWAASRVAVIDGVEYVHSNANPQIYQVWDTLQWHDDSPSGEPLSYDSVLVMAYQNNGRRQGMNWFNKYLFEGYMAEGTQLDAILYYDYQGSRGALNPNINSVAKPATFFSGANAPSLGDDSLGDNPLGDGLTQLDNDQLQLPKFRAICNVGMVNFFEYQVLVYSSNADDRWEMLCLGPNMGVNREQQAGFITK